MSTRYQREMLARDGKLKALASLIEDRRKANELIDELKGSLAQEILTVVLNVLVDRSSPSWSLYSHGRKEPERFPQFGRRLPEETDVPDGRIMVEPPIVAYFTMDRGAISTNKLHFIVDNHGRLFFIQKSRLLAELPKDEKELLKLLSVPFTKVEYMADAEQSKNE